MTFMNNKFLRNTTAFLFEILTLCFSSYGIFISINNRFLKDFTYWTYIITIFIAAFVFKCLARRLWVIKVCPNCCENRALVSTKINTGNSRFIDVVKESDGYHKIFEDEYEVTDECKFGCGFKYVEYVTEERDEEV